MVLLYRSAIVPWDNLVMGDVTTYYLLGRALETEVMQKACL